MFSLFSLPPLPPPKKKTTLMDVFGQRDSTMRMDDDDDDDDDCFCPPVCFPTNWGIKGGFVKQSGIDEECDACDIYNVIVDDDEDDDSVIEKGSWLDTDDRPGVINTSVLHCARALPVSALPPVGGAICTDSPAPHLYTSGGGEMMMYSGQQNRRFKKTLSHCERRLSRGRKAITLRKENRDKNMLKRRKAMPLSGIVQDGLDNINEIISIIKLPSVPKKELTLAMKTLCAFASEYTAPLIVLYNKDVYPALIKYASMFAPGCIDIQHTSLWIIINMLAADLDIKANDYDDDNKKNGSEMSTHRGMLQRMIRYEHHVTETDTIDILDIFYKILCMARDSPKITGVVVSIVNLVVRGLGNMSCDIKIDLIPNVFTRFDYMSILLFILERDRGQDTSIITGNSKTFILSILSNMTTMLIDSYKPNKERMIAMQRCVFSVYKIIIFDENYDANVLACAYKSLSVFCEKSNEFAFVFVNETMIIRYTINKVLHTGHVGLQLSAWKFLAELSHIGNDIHVNFMIKNNIFDMVSEYRGISNPLIQNQITYMLSNICIKKLWTVQAIRSRSINVALDFFNENKSPFSSECEDLMWIIVNCLSVVGNGDGDKAGDYIYSEIVNMRLVKTFCDILKAHMNVAAIAILAISFFRDYISHCKSDSAAMDIERHGGVALMRTLKCDDHNLDIQKRVTDLMNKFYPDEYPSEIGDMRGDYSKMDYDGVVLSNYNF